MSKGNAGTRFLGFSGLSMVAFQVVDVLTPNMDASYVEVGVFGLVAGAVATLATRGRSNGAAGAIAGPKQGVMDRVFSAAAKQKYGDR